VPDFFETLRSVVTSGLHVRTNLAVFLALHLVVRMQALVAAEIAREPMYVKASGAVTAFSG
jgi:hypothetical protein